ncbi:MAG: hypothetical protein ACU0BB_12315 [Paracoccaceae bacterium]
MTSNPASVEYSALIERVRNALREQEGISGKDLATALHKGRRRLPKRVLRQGQVLLQGEALARHPKLAMTMDLPAMRKSADEICTYLKTIDRADRRKGFWLGLLGGMAFNILMLIVLFLALLYWRDLI